MDTLRSIHPNLYGWSIYFAMVINITYIIFQPELSKNSIKIFHYFSDYYIILTGPACKFCHLQKFNHTRNELGQAKPNKKRRIFKGNKKISESKYQKNDPKVEFDPDVDIPEDLSMPKIIENAGQKTPQDLTRSSSSSLELFESNSSSNQVRIEPPSKSLNLTTTTPSHKTLPQLAPNYNNQRFRMYYPKIL